MLVLYLSMISWIYACGRIHPADEDLTIASRSLHHQLTSGCPLDASCRSGGLAGDIESQVHSLSFRTAITRSSLLRLFRLSSPQLLLRRLFLHPLGILNCACSRDCRSPQIRAVTVLCGLTGDGLVNPTHAEKSMHQHDEEIPLVVTPPEDHTRSTHFLFGVPFVHEVELVLLAGRLPFFLAFLVVKVTPSPPGPG